MEGDREFTWWERAFNLGRIMERGEAVTVATVAEMFGVDHSTAYRMLAYRAARCAPLTCEKSKDGESLWFLDGGQCAT